MMFKYIYALCSVIIKVTFIIPFLIKDKKKSLFSNFSKYKEHHCSVFTPIGQWCTRISYFYWTIIFIDPPFFPSTTNIIFTNWKSSPCLNFSGIKVFIYYLWERSYTNYLLKFWLISHSIIASTSIILSQVSEYYLV